MISLLGAFVTWLPVLALLYIPGLAKQLASLLARHCDDGLDWQIPDELPMTAGEWLVERIARLRYPIEAVATDHSVDAYQPTNRLIQLHTRTYFKADPVYWATAAHELGHARVHAEFPILMALRRITMQVRPGLIAAGIGLLLGRVLYALPIAGALAFCCFALAAGSTIVTLIDEAAASVIAYRELRGHAALTAVHRRAIARSLITAFATYLVTYVSWALLLRYWPLVEALAGHRGAHPRELTGLGHAVAVVATIGCAAAIVSRLTWSLAPGAHGGVAWGGWWGRIELSGWAASVILMWLAWDHRVDTAYAWCAILAFASSYRTWLVAGYVLALIPDRLVHYVLSSSQSHGPERTQRYLDAAKQGAGLVRRGNDWLAQLHQRAAEAPSWFARLAALTALGFVPLLVALWLR